MTYGTVFDLKEFSIYDGDGMRTTVFLKGCPLKCKWCHNPEGLSPYPEVMYNSSACVKCGKCVVNDCQKINNGLCTACGKCIDVCPSNLRQIKGTKYSAQELIDILNDYAPFYGEDGGVTFSGGEPTMQFDFLCEVLSGIKGKTGIETCGYCSEDRFKKIVEKLSFVYMDFKVFDSEKHKFYTGVDNAVIKRNLENLKQSGKSFTIRIPLIKGVNDDVENLSNTAKLLVDVPTLKRVELLPYNALAPAKYPMVNREFACEFEKPTNIITTPFTERGISVKIL